MFQLLNNHLWLLTTVVDCIALGWNRGPGGETFSSSDLLKFLGAAQFPETKLFSKSCTIFLYHLKYALKIFLDTFPLTVILIDSNFLFFTKWVKIFASLPYLTLHPSTPIPTQRWIFNKFKGPHIFTMVPRFAPDNSSGLPQPTDVGKYKLFFLFCWIFLVQCWVQSVFWLEHQLCH